MLALGVQESATFNDIFTVINVLILIYIVIIGSFRANLKNWSLTKDDHIPPTAGSGGFFPFGFSGMMAGAATCFYGFIGFDSIAASGKLSFHNKNC